MREETDTHGISAWAARQRGLIHYEQLLALGLSAQRIGRLVDAGFLHRIHRGVYAVGHPAITPLARCLAATMALKGTGSYEMAGWLWGALEGAPALAVTVPITSGRGHRDGIAVHRQPLDPREITARAGVPCTTLTRTLIDLGAVLDAKALLNAFELAQVHHRLRPHELAAEVIARPGHRGSRQLRHMLDGAVDPAKVESVLELRFKALCRRFGLPEPLTQVWFGPYRVDFWFPDRHVVVETDGGFHRLPTRRRTDAAKAAFLDARGETVVRATYAEVTYAPEQTAQRVTAALATPSSRRRS